MTGGHDDPDGFVGRIDPAIVPILELVPTIDLGDIPAMRSQLSAMMAAYARTLPDVGDVTTTAESTASADGHLVALRVSVHDDRASRTPAMLWMHGGGMVLGSAHESDNECRQLASAYGCAVVSVDYRLAPEHPYPAAIEDCCAALAWLNAHADTLGVDADRIVIAGSSAGAGLAAGLALLARDRHDLPIAFQYLLYPMLDDRDRRPSHASATSPNAWNRQANRIAWRAYLDGADGSAEVPIYAAPARATVENLRGLPPAYIDVGDMDAFRDEDMEYAAKLLQAGVPCELHVTPGAFHASENFGPEAPTSQRIKSYRADVLRRVLT